jgi:DNA-binding GntR family transcriptional regulator
VLEALAADQPGHPLSSDYQRRHGLPSVATVQTALRALSRDGIVDRRGRGSYAIAEPFLGEWISLQTG